MELRVHLMGFSGCLGAKSGHRGLWRQHKKSGESNGQTMDNEMESGIILV